jgi:hypothetical protein
VLSLSKIVPNTQFDIDDRCRVMLEDGYSLTKVFACGIGYPIRTKDGMAVKGPKNLNHPRADGFSIYLNQVGD